MRKLQLYSLLLVLLIGVAACQDDPETLPNIVPVADAGPSKIITLPENSVSLTGTGTDADGTVVAYLWSQVSGPEASILINPGSAATTAKGLVEGTYIFQLMVTDEDGATGVDTVSVTVNHSNETRILELQPANNDNERMIVEVGGADQSWTGSSELIIDAWTVGGQSYVGRAAFKFDLTAIPANATILSANLFLHSNTPPQNGNLTDANFGTDNSLFLQRITGNWSPAVTTWNNQPSVSTADQISIAATTQSSLDLNIDVKDLVSTMVHTNTNYGFLLRLQSETQMNSRMFVSSFHSTKVDKRPKLVVNYSL